MPRDEQKIELTIRMILEGRPSVLAMVVSDIQNESVKAAGGCLVEPGRYTIRNVK